MAEYEFLPVTTTTTTTNHDHLDYDEDEEEGSLKETVACPFPEQDQRVSGSLTFRDPPPGPFHGPSSLPSFLASLFH